MTHIDEEIIQEGDIGRKIGTLTDKVRNSMCEIERETETVKEIDRQTKVTDKEWNRDKSVKTLRDILYINFVYKLL